MCRKLHKTKHGAVEPCATEESQKNTGSDSLVSGTATDDATLSVDKPTAMIAQDSSGMEASCANCQVNKDTCQGFQAAMSQGVKPEEVLCDDWTWKVEERKVRNDMNELCRFYGKDDVQECWKKPGAPDLCMKSDEVKCSYFSENEKKTAENNAFLPKNVSKTDEIVTFDVAFDYSSVDEETAEFLIEKQNNILRIKTMSMLAIAKELKEAQDKLSNHNQGTFISWCESIGYPKSTTYDYLRTYDWVVRNSDNAIDFEGMQKSLLLSVSKPSAPKELQQAVLSGDIKTHKEYKELESKLQETEYRLKAVGKSNERFEQANREFEKEVQKLKTENRNTFEAYQKDLKNLHQQIDQARQDSDKVRVLELQKEINDLRQQLKDKPIEATATRVVERVPEDIEAIQYHLQKFAKVNHVLNQVVGLSTDEMQSWAMMMNNRKAVNDDDESETLELLATAIQSLQDMMDDYESRRCE